MKMGILHVVAIPVTKHVSCSSIPRDYIPNTKVD
jgi:hypothetical protein